MRSHHRPMHPHARGRDGGGVGASEGDDATAMLLEQTMTQYRGWMRFFVLHDSQADWERLRVPALAVFGGRDVQVDPELHRVALEAVVGEGATDGGPRSGAPGDGAPADGAAAEAALVTIVTLPEANHLMQAATTGGVSEYAQLSPEPTPTLLETLADWLATHVPVGE